MAISVQSLNQIKSPFKKNYFKNQQTDLDISQVITKTVKWYIRN